MAKSKARFLAEILGSDGKVQKGKSKGFEEIALNDLPTITNAKLQNSAVTFAGETASLGGSASLNTGDITEHTNYKYFTDSRSRGSISASLAGGHGAVSYNSTTGALSITGVSTEAIQDVVGAMFSSNTESGITVTYDDNDGTIDLSVTALNTGNVSEGSNLYHTTARARSAISATGSLSYNSSTGVMSFTMPAQNTSNITEGSNLYFTNARAISAVTGSDLDMSGRKVLFGNMYSAENNLPSASTYHGMFAHVHGTGKGYFAHGGNWIKLLDESSSTTANLTEGSNLYYTNARADARIAAADTGDLSEGSNLYYTTTRANSAIDARVTQSMVNALGINATHLNSYTGGSYALKASPALTGTPTAPTAAANTNTTQIATTAYVQTELTDLIDGAPGTLDSLNELAAAINDDSNYNSTLTTALATKVNKTSNQALGNAANVMTISGNTITLARGDSTTDTVTVPDTNTTYTTATSSALGLVKIGYTESGKNYPVELSSGQMYVNVPWVDTNTDTNTTYTGGTNISLSGTTFNLDNQIVLSTGVVGAKGAFGTGQSAVHSTYHLYNNSLTYLNGNTIIDANLTISGGGQILGSPNITAGRVVTSGLYGIGHGSSTLPIWQYNAGNPGYGIAYTEASPDVLRFDVSNNLMSGTADLELRPNDLRVNGSTVWNAGNDGSGSGLDADLLDGQQGSYYLAWANVTGKPTIPTNNNQLTNGAGYITASGNAATSHAVTGSAFATTGSPGSVLEYQQAASITDTKLAPSGDWHNTIRMGHGNPYSYYSNTLAMQMTGTGTGRIRTQTISNNTALGWREVWDSGNDGSGSGLDADLLDGNQATAFATAAQGTLATNALPTNNPTATGTLVSPIIRARKSQTQGNYTTAALWTESFSSTNTGIAFHISGNVGKMLDMRTDGHLYWENGRVWSATSDGSGSGLDADLLDGNHASAFLGVSAKAADSNLLDGVTWASQTKAVAARNWTTEAGDGQGLTFWGGTGTALAGSYAIAMSSQGNSNAGRHSLDSSSDYNMYFKMSAGTDRGFVFKNGSSNVAAITKSGRFLGSAVYLDGSSSQNQYVAADSTHSLTIRNMGATSSGGVVLQGSDGTHGLQLYWDGSGANYGFLDGAWAAWDIQKVKNGTFKVDEGAGLKRVLNEANWSSYITLPTDANTIDGRSFVNTGSNSAQNSDTINSNGISYYTSGVTNFSGNATDGALYSQQYSSSWQHQIAGDYRSGQIAVRGKNNGTWTSWNKVWTAGNDGSGSGLDADLLDGLNSATAATAGTIVARDGNGYINGIYFNSAIGISEALSLDITKIYVSNDNYIRTMGKSDFKVRMGLTKSDYDRMDYTTSTHYHTGANSHNDTTFNGLLQRGCGFIDNWNGGAGKPPTGSHYNGFQALHYGNGSSYFHGMQMVMDAGNPSNTFLRGWWANGGSGYGWQKIWTDGNDGSGSGLDADTVDGFDGTHLNRGTNSSGVFPGSSGHNLNDVFTSTPRAGFIDAWSGSNFPPGTTHIQGIQTRHNTSTHYGWQLFGQYNQAGKLYHRQVSNNSWGSWSTMWSSGNDGSGSGLDADVLDGVQAASFVRSDNNDTLSEQYTFTKVNDHAIRVGTIRGTVVGSQSGEYIMMYNRVAIGSPVGWGSRAAPNYGLSTYGGADLATDTGSVTISGSTAWHAGNDGSGSGLDADLLDGVDSTKYFKSPGNVSAWERNNANFSVQGGDASNVGLHMEQSNSVFGFQLYGASGTYGFLDAEWGSWDIQKVASGTFKVDEGNGLQRVWNAGNDGSGSGLDADLLDGLNAKGVGSATGASQVLTSNTNSYFVHQNWIDIGANGLYSSSTNGAHFRPNNVTSYGSWASSGSKGGYDGIAFDGGGDVAIMFDSAGNGGFYRQANSRWMNYHHISDACTGFNASTTSSSYTIYVTGAIYATGDVVGSSDVRLKKNINTIENGLAKVEKLRGVTYEWKDSKESGSEGNNVTPERMGVIAQEIVDIVPEVVTHDKENDRYGVSYGHLTGVLIEAIKELSDKVKELEKKLEEK